METIDNKIVDKVYQMVMWGEPREAVFAYLSQQGFGNKEARELYSSLLKERAAIIRKKYICRVILGAGLLVFAVWLGLLAIHSERPELPNRGAGALLGISSLLLAFGVSLVAGGIVKIVTAKTASGSIASGNY